MLKSYYASCQGGEIYVQISSLDEQNRWHRNQQAEEPE